MRMLVIHGAGMETRGKVDIPTFGPMTMDDYTKAIRAYAAGLNIEVEVFHSLDVATVIAKLQACRTAGIDGIIINPASFTVGQPVLAQAIRDTGLPSVEVHVSNPAARGVVSEIARGTRCAVAGFGVRGYLLALQGLRELIVAT